MTLRAQGNSSFDNQNPEEIKFNTSAEFAREMDEKDPLKHYRDVFIFPEGKEGYFTGNSLGLISERAKQEILKEISDWEKFGEDGHFPWTDGKENDWLGYHRTMSGPLSRLVGAKEGEVAVMGTLTSNIHLLLTHLYNPTKQRSKIMIEGHAFPSDQYAVASHIDALGYKLTKLLDSSWFFNFCAKVKGVLSGKFNAQASDEFAINSNEAIIRLQPQSGEYTLCTNDILKQIEEHGDEVAVLMLGAVNYYTGELLDIKAITEAAHKKSIIVGLDLAHATGNIPLNLNELGVDFAAGCSYKYINGGPGAIGFIFVHEKYHKDLDLPRHIGWWANKVETRFQMKDKIDLAIGAEGLLQSNIPIFSSATVKASLDMFDEVGIEKLREKSLLLTDYLYFLLDSLESDKFEVITPREHDARGAQFSIVVKENGKAVHAALEDAGMVCDWREPDCIRVTPAPFYNNFSDLHKFVTIFAGKLGLDFNQNLNLGEKINLIPANDR